MESEERAQCRVCGPNVSQDHGIFSETLKTNSVASPVSCEHKLVTQDHGIFSETLNTNSVASPVSEKVVRAG